MTPTTDSSPRVAGIDRWRKGWIIAVIDSGEVSLESCADVEAAIAATDDCAAVAIDIPLALPTRGGRSAEVDVRSFLGAAGRSVFYSPTRAAILASSRAEASDINREYDGPGISAQAWGLCGSIREARAALADHHRCSLWWETHPETAFALMNGGNPLMSKRSTRGVIARLDLLTEIFPAILTALRASPHRVPIDDALDAVAAAWSARRIAADQALCFGPIERDDQGFPLGVRI